MSNSSKGPRIPQIAQVPVQPDGDNELDQLMKMGQPTSGDVPEDFTASPTPNADAAEDQEGIGDDRREGAVHPTRAQESRPPVHGSEFQDSAWTPPTSLEAPPARPGYSQRYIRVSVGNDHDATRLQNALREGWKPRDPATLPSELVDLTPRITEGRYAGAIGVHGLILMEMPTERVQQRKAYYENADAASLRAVRDELQGVATYKHMPLEQERNTEVGFGDKRRPVVAGDGGKR